MNTEHTHPLPPYLYTLVGDAAHLIVGTHAPHYIGQLYLGMTAAEAQARNPHSPLVQVGDWRIYIVLTGSIDPTTTLPPAIAREMAAFYLEHIILPNEKRFNKYTPTYVPFKDRSPEVQARHRAEEDKRKQWKAQRDGTQELEQ